MPTGLGLSMVRERRGHGVDVTASQNRLSFNQARYRAWLTAAGHLRIRLVGQAFANMSEMPYSSTQFRTRTDNGAAMSRLGARFPRERYCLGNGIASPGNHTFSELRLPARWVLSSLRPSLDVIGSSKAHTREILARNKLVVGHKAWPIAFHICVKSQSAPIKSFLIIRVIRKERRTYRSVSALGISCFSHFTNMRKRHLCNR